MALNNEAQHRGGKFGMRLTGVDDIIICIDSEKSTH